MANNQVSDMNIPSFFGTEKSNWVHEVSSNLPQENIPLRILVKRVVGGTVDERAEKVNELNRIYFNARPWFAPSFSPETQSFSAHDMKMAILCAKYTYSHPGQDYSDDAYEVVVYATRDFKPNDQLLAFINRKCPAIEKVNLDLDISTSCCLCM